MWDNFMLFLFPSASLQSHLFQLLSLHSHNTCNPLSPGRHSFTGVQDGGFPEMEEMESDPQHGSGNQLWQPGSQFTEATGACHAESPGMPLCTEKTDLRSNSPFWLHLRSLPTFLPIESCRYMLLSNFQKPAHKFILKS